MGQHGMTKNRLTKMRQLQAMMFSKDEDELNEKDPWRYCRAPVEAYNDRRRRLIIPSWLLDEDELMCAWTGQESVQVKSHHPPHLLTYFTYFTLLTYFTYLHLTYLLAHLLTY